jgi:cation diffusion facilitator family transporter
MQTHSSSEQAHRITVAGLIVNFLLAGLKLGLGLLGRSQAVVADAVHSLSDMGTDLLVLIGLRFWSAPADEKHPYGHQRIETFVTLLISVLLASVAVGLGWHAIHRLGEPAKCSPLSIAVLGPLVSIVAKEILFRRTRAIGRRIHSSALIANAWHHRSDALSSIPALVAVTAASLSPKWAFLDPVGALIVALLILKVAWDIAYPALSELTERGADDEEVQTIANLTRSVDGVCSVHKIRTRRLGAGWFVDLHVNVDGDQSVRQGHDIATNVQRLLLEDGPSVIDVTVHIEPEEES